VGILFFLSIQGGLVMTATATAKKSKPAAADVDRDAEIRAALEAFETLRRRYIESPGDVDSPPGLGMFEAAAEIVHALNAGPVPYDLAGAVGPVEELGTWLLGLAEKPETNFGELTGDGLFRRVDDILAAVDAATRPAPKLETVAELLEQEVAIHQIAKMHGLSEAQVKQEKETPGSVCGPDYVPPIFAKWAADRAEAAKNWSVGALLSGLSNKLKALGL
jgi:hypothetical protein